MSKTSKRLLLLGATTLVVGLVAEFAYRAVRTPPENLMHFRDAGRHLAPKDPNAEILFRLQFQVPWANAAFPPGMETTPRSGTTSEWFGTGYAMPRDNLLGNVTWRPGSRFFICYRGP